MRTALFVLNPRRIEECLDSIRALDIDRIWLTGFAEWELVDAVASVVAEETHDRYLMVSDDCIVSQEALDAVLALLDAGHQVVTGWCRLDSQSDLVNLTVGPVRGDRPAVDAYTFRTRDEVLAHPTEDVPTGFAGWALTGMSRELWQRYPFRVFGAERGGYGSDFHLSMRLRDHNVPIVAARDGEIEHVKEVWNRADRDPRKQLHIGDPREIVVEVAA